MELVYIGRALWAKRRLVAGAATLALACALLTLYQVTPIPPGVHSRTAESGVATTEVLIDAPKSALGDLARDITPLTARGGIFTRFLTTEQALDGIARESGAPRDQIVVTGPPLAVAGVPDQGSVEQLRKLSATRAYQVQVLQGDQLPMLTISAHAPTADAAKRLADGTALALTDVVKSVQERTGVPEKRRLTIRQLGEARATDLTDGPSPALAAAVFVVILGLLCGAILVWPAVAAAWRSSAPPAASPRDKPVDADEVTPGEVTPVHGRRDPHVPRGGASARESEAILTAALADGERRR